MLIKIPSNSYIESFLCVLHYCFVLFTCCNTYSQPDLLKGVYGMGFSKPSKIQETALPLLLAKP